MAEHVAGLHERDVAAEQAQVRPAGDGQLHPQDHVLGVEDLRVGDLLDRHLVDSLPAQRLHSRPSSRPCAVTYRSGTVSGVGRVVPGRSGLSTSPVSRICLEVRRADPADLLARGTGSRAVAGAVRARAAVGARPGGAAGARDAVGARPGAAGLPGARLGNPRRESASRGVGGALAGGWCGQDSCGRFRDLALSTRHPS